MKRMTILASLLLGFTTIGTVFATAARADTIGPITFESPAYTVGNIHGQNGWTKTGPYDVLVALNSAYPAAADYGFGAQSLRLSDAITSGSFADQTFSPGLANAAGESLANHFDSTFSIGTTLDTLQSGLHLSVSPDDGNGSRMSFLRFDDLADGVHVFFDDVTNPGPVGTGSIFNETDIATLSRTSAHTIRFSIDFKAGPGNDVVKIYIDGALEITGTTWEDYYRYDPEQSGNGNVVPNVRKMLFRESGTAHPANIGQGFLVDNLSLSSATHPTSVNQCKKNGWKTFTNPTFKNQGECILFFNNK